MFGNFESAFNNNAKQAGAMSINVPAHLTYPAKISLWGKVAGSMAYYYVLYDLESFDFNHFQSYKQIIEKGVQTISERNSIRHTVVVNILVSQGRIEGESAGLISSAEEFALGHLYEMYFGVELMSEPKLVESPAALPDISGAAGLIRRSLENIKMFHVEHFYDDQIYPLQIYARPVAKRPILFYVIMGINILVFALMEAAGGSADTMNLIRFGAIARILVFEFGEWWRFVTPLFIHIGFMHLMFNSMSLVLFGIRVEKYFGHVKFIIIYIVSGIAGNVAMIAFSPYALGAGASGSIFGLVGALFAFVKVRKLQIENLNSSALGIMIVLSVLMGFANTGFMGGVAVANSAHIGGLISGFLLGLAFSGKRSE